MKHCESSFKKLRMELPIHLAITLGMQPKEMKAGLHNSQKIETTRAHQQINSFKFLGSFEKWWTLLLDRMLF